MKRIIFFTSSILVILSCSRESINPPYTTVSIGQPFVLAAPYKVVIHEGSLSFKLERFSDFESGLGLTGYDYIQTKIVFNKKVFNLVHSTQCDWPYHNCTPNYFPEASGKKEYTYGGIGYYEFIPLNETLKLTFRRVTKSTVVKEYEGGGQIHRIDSAEFIIEPM